MKVPMQDKSPEMINQIEALFLGTKQAIAESKCPLCLKSIKAFRDVLSQREYEISGLCQDCQDDIFGENGMC